MKIKINTIHKVNQKANTLSFRILQGSLINRITIILKLLDNLTISNLKRLK